MAALAFVACQKEESKENDRFIPIFYPNAISCLDNAGMTLEIKSDRPSMFAVASFIKDGEQTNTLEEYTYQLTIKPFVDELKLVFYFLNPKNTYRPGYIAVTCGYEFTGSFKEYLDNMHNLDN